MIEDVKSLYSGLRGGAVSLNTGGPAVEPMMMAAVFVGALSTYGLDQQFAESRKKKADGSCSSDPGCGSDSSRSSCSSGTRHAAAVRRAAAAAAAVVAVAGVEDHDHA